MTSVLHTTQRCPKCNVTQHPNSTKCLYCDVYLPGHEPLGEKPLGDHYRRGGIEAWDVIEAWDLGFNTGNIIKYAARCGVKTPDRSLDLEKIKAYIEREIEEEKRRESKGK